MKHALLALVSVGAFFACAEPVRAALFDFDTAPINTSLPIDATSDGITAHLSGTSYAVWRADVWGFTPVGFSGLSIWPSSVFQSDLTISFDTPLSDWSILYATQENGTDNSGIVRATGYLGVASVVTGTQQAPGGTWPTATIGLHSAGGFDRVVMHWVSHPAGDTDYGPIFTVDNMNATADLPEPGSLGLLALGASGVLCRRCRRR